jgi:class 3 adenylate cyclase
MHNLLRTSVINSVARYIDDINSLSRIYKGWYDNRVLALKKNFIKAIDKTLEIAEIINTKNYNSVDKNTFEQDRQKFYDSLQEAYLTSSDLADSYGIKSPEKSTINLFGSKIVNCINKIDAGLKDFHFRGIERGVQIFLWTDIENSTGLTQKYGDVETRNTFRKHDEIVRDCLQKNNGKEIKHTGDGIIAVFISPTDAINTALEIQRALKGYRANNSEIALHVRIGINAGEPIAERDDFFGATVNLTKRICDEANADQILVSDIVKQLCIGKSFLFKELQTKLLKGFDEPIKMFLVDDK